MKSGKVIGKERGVYVKFSFFLMRLYRKN